MTATSPKNRWLIASMVLAIAGITALAAWDANREAASALDDFAEEQATLAASVASDLSSRLAGARRDALVLAQNSETGCGLGPALAARYEAIQTRAAGAPQPAPPTHAAFLLTVPLAQGRLVDLVMSSSELFAGVERIEKPHELVLLVQPPGERGFHTTDGRLVSSDAITQALADGHAARRLERPEAVALGLPERMALAGLAHANGGALGSWGVAVVATAGAERDRERRAFWRVVLASALAGGLVLVFGGIALRNQRHELQLAHRLALAQAHRERDERLERESKAATMVTLASGVAHEVSTPLGVIAGRAEQLRTKVGADERAQKSVQTILEQTDRIHQVVRGFLALARGGRPVMRSIEPAAVIGGAVALVEHRFAQAGVQLVQAPLPNLPSLSGDQRLLEQALVNLLRNACDACVQGGRVSLGARQEEGDVVFEVVDDGAGIPPAIAARVLEPFFTTKPPEQGTGIGLSITNEIVKIHRGRLSLEPAQPQGTRALVRIPLGAGGIDAAA